MRTIREAAAPRTTVDTFLSRADPWEGGPVAVAMLRSSFGRETALFGIFVMLLAIVAGASWFVPALGVVILNG